MFPTSVMSLRYEKHELLGLNCPPDVFENPVPSTALAQGAVNGCAACSKLAMLLGVQLPPPAQAARVAGVQPEPGAGWLMLRGPSNLAPWFPTYPTSIDRLLVIARWMSRFQ